VKLEDSKPIHVFDSAGEVAFPIHFPLAKTGLRVGELRYLTGHACDDILNEYTSVRPEVMKDYFRTVQPLIDTVAARAVQIGIGQPFQSVNLSFNSLRRSVESMRIPTALASMQNSVGVGKRLGCRARRNFRSGCCLRPRPVRITQGCARVLW